jgi:hypothetical protein
MHSVEAVRRCNASDQKIMFLIYKQIGTHYIHTILYFASTPDVLVKLIKRFEKNTMHNIINSC